DLLMLLLQEQQELTAVDRFSQYHETVSCPESRPTYETLLPVTPLEPGEQYAFSVDLDRCSGCKACVVACHNQNGLDEKEAWRDVGLLYSTSQALPVMQHITAACHHCVNPACMNACPTNSYEKDPVTGIVRHLDDQCFGCQYCTLACPYGVPKYHAEKGIVRKCDMCSQRLAKNEAPACVQSCPHEAISITKIKQSEAREKGIAGTFLAGTHNPSYTVPTTIYHSNRLENINSSEPDPGFLVRGDEHALHPEHAHWPLILMLTLIQLSVGIFLGLSLLQALGQIPLNGARWLALTGFGISQLALAFATLHLGRPHYMFRGILGFRHSWMSREIVALGIYSAAAGTCLASFWLPEALVPFQGLLQTISPWLTVASGYLGLFCSMMIYQCTQRVYWNGVDTSLKFFGTTVVTGFAFLTVVLPLLETFMGISIP
ncbi:MAG: dimethyl sulfoxide reductase anchor subunit, partial [Planctomycetaceae bacterium]|nr:dimethyl sulfoxide reductase anchor subunit [Planctomycetaceae bacterium]